MFDPDCAFSFISRTQGCPVNQFCALNATCSSSPLVVSNFVVSPLLYSFTISGGFTKEHGMGTLIDAPFQTASIGSLVPIALARTDSDQVPFEPSSRYLPNAEEVFESPSM